MQKSEKPFNLWVCLFIFYNFFSCNFINHFKSDASMYYWKQKFNLKPIENEFIESHKIEKLYVKFFDIIRLPNNEFKPISIIEFDSNSTRNKKIIPVIFITNNCFEHITDSGIMILAQSSFLKVNKLFPVNAISYPEIQIDCDWNLSTKNMYFKFVEEIKKVSKKYISCTIRLHQIKYVNTTGCPPCNEGMLMCYNVDDIKKRNTRNSIINSKIAIDYLKNIDIYPIKLSIGYPIFYWGIVFVGDEFDGILNNLSIKDLKDYEQLKKIVKKGNIIIVKEKISLHNKEIYPGTIIRFEHADINEISNIKKFLLENTKVKFQNTILFHLDSNCIEGFKEKEINSILN